MNYQGTFFLCIHCLLHNLVFSEWCLMFYSRNASQCKCCCHIYYNVMWKFTTWDTVEFKLTRSNIFNSYHHCTLNVSPFVELMLSCITIWLSSAMRVHLLLTTTSDLYSPAPRPCALLHTHEPRLKKKCSWRRPHSLCTQHLTLRTCMIKGEPND